MINIRRAKANDIEKILAVLESGRVFLQSQGLSQWQGGHGPSQRVEKEIANNWGYVFVLQEDICGYAALVEGVDECYTNIKEGCWDSSCEKYISIHGVAICDEFRGKGFAGLFMRQLIETVQGMGYCDIRIDTHPLNEIMQKVILRAGFVYRGMVEFNIPDGERRAYQLKNNFEDLL
jgi:GNAT superfamily N-acetyltransferase